MSVHHIGKSDIRYNKLHMRIYEDYNIQANIKSGNWKQLLVSSSRTQTLGEVF